MDVTEILKDTVTEGKYVELKYQVIDVRTGSVLTEVEYPLGYVHGVNQVLAPMVTRELEGKVAGDVIKVPIDCNQLYEPRDESLVITDLVENVPEEYREIGTAILMENDKGEAKSFLVTRMDDKTITIDGNNPLCGREVVFKLYIVSVRDATLEELQAGGKVEEGPDLNGGRTIPL